MTPRKRVAVYVIRKDAEAPQLLVFDHQNAPEAGTQIPAGGVNKNESILDAAIREVREEVGVCDLQQIRILGEQLLPHHGTGQMRHTTYVVAQSTDTRSAWHHTVASADDDDEMVFRCHWVDLDQAESHLIEEQAAFLSLVQMG